MQIVLYYVLRTIKLDVVYYIADANINQIGKCLLV